jgi:AcrR family transcriptional regulator
LNAPETRKSFRETQFELREEAILDATNRLLADHGYEAMSMDEVSGKVGIAKGSLYRHFESKEALAAAVLTRLLRQTTAALAGQSTQRSAIERLEGLLRWTLSQRLSGGVPHLPSTSPSLQQALFANLGYMDELTRLSDQIGALIVQARSEGSIKPHLRDEFILYTLYARTCDPTLDFLKAAGSMSNEQIIDQIVSACFHGLTT